MPILSVDQILNAPDLKEQEIEVPEWGGAVKIRAFTKGDMQRIRQEATLKHNTPTGKRGDIDQNHLEMLMFVRGVCEPQFEPSHILALKQKAAGPFQRVLKQILDISGLTEEAIEEAETTFPLEPGAEV